MSDSKDNLRPEIGHVLFIDIVGYSKLLTEEQKERLHSSPRSCSRPRRCAKRRTNNSFGCRPAIAALVFRHNVEDSARCALEGGDAAAHQVFGLATPGARLLRRRSRR